MTYRIARIWDAGGMWGEFPHGRHATPEDAFRTAYYHAERIIEDGGHEAGDDELATMVRVTAQVLSDGTDAFGRHTYDELRSWDFDLI